MCNRTVMESLLIPLFNAAAYHHLGIYPSSKELGSQGTGMRRNEHRESGRQQPTTVLFYHAV